MACERLYDNSKKHHEYMKDKMNPKPLERMRFINKSSERLVQNMENRKPLYHIREQIDSDQSDNPKSIKIKPLTGTFQLIF